MGPVCAVTYGASGQGCECKMAPPCVRYRTESAGGEANNRHHDKRLREDRQAPQRTTGMNRDRIEGNWKQFRGQLQERWGRFTGDANRERAGMRDRLEGRVLERYGISKEQAARELEDFRRRNRDWNPSKQ
jgi:uncharacterized protein YjbJ (UPF0337 family)